MPTYCSVPQCKSLSSREKLKFHKIPDEKQLRKLWLLSIKTGKKPTPSTLVCSKHFKTSDYMESSTGLRKILVKGAVPSQNLPKRVHEKVPKPRRTKNSNREVREALASEVRETLASEVIDSVEPILILDDIEYVNVASINMEVTAITHSDAQTQTDPKYTNILRSISTQTKMSLK